MADEKESKNVAINFPCGNLEEMLRVMRKCREQGDIDCEAILKQFMGRDHKNIDFRRMKKKNFDNGSKELNLEELMKNCRKE